MDLHLVNILLQIIVFLLAISVHESAHAWMANRCGDPTAKMLGRITLDPLKHIDPFGTILLPAIGLITGAGIFGWAKPCPVTPENFENPVRGDILTTVAGPLSNLLLVSISLVALVSIALISGEGKEIVHNLAFRSITETNSVLMPIAWFFYTMMSINVLLFVFNLLPIPPLDGSHVIRHMLPEPVRYAYDKIGMFGFIIVFAVGGKLIGAIMIPIYRLFNGLLLSI